jgi:predicted MFS family arabinose efflux permease
MRPSPRDLVDRSRSPTKTRSPTEVHVSSDTLIPTGEPILAGAGLAVGAVPAYAPPVTWRALLRQRSFRRLWLADAVSMFGDWFTYVAVGTLALSQGTGLVAVAVVLLAHTLPRALLAPLAGRLADRHDRRTLLVAGNLLRALAVLGMLAAAVAGQTIAVQALLFVRMALAAFTEPASGAALPQLVPSARLAPANALLGATWSVLFAVGVAAGGFVTAWLGPASALAIDAATFMLAALLLSGLPPLRPGETHPDSAASDPQSHDTHHDRGSLRDAWALARRDPPLWRAAVAKLPVMLANGGAWIVLHALAAGQRFGDAALALGVLHGARAVGTGLGPLLWARSARLAGTTTGLHVAAWTTFVAVAAFTLSSSPAVAVLASSLWGVGVGATWVTAATRLQTLAPNRALGRLTAIDLLTHTLGQCLGGLAGAVLADRLGDPALAGWLGLGLGALAWLALAR